MKRDILPTGLNFRDIWGSFEQSNLPSACEHCGREASSKSLTVSRKHWNMDLCSECRHLKFQGLLGDPREDVRTEPVEPVDEPPLPF